MARHGTNVPKVHHDAVRTRRPALLAQLPLSQPTVPEALSILRGLRARYERHHSTRITDGALVAAVELSNRYTADRYLPDKVKSEGSQLRGQLGIWVGP